MPVIDEWMLDGARSARIREDALHFSYEVNYGPGWSPRTMADFQEVARRLKWALTARADQIRREEVVRIRKEVVALADLMIGAAETAQTASPRAASILREFRTRLDRICPEEG